MKARFLDGPLQGIINPFAEDSDLLELQVFGTEEAVFYQRVGVDFVTGIHLFKLLGSNVAKTFKPSEELVLTDFDKRLLQQCKISSD